ncbi:hypothetical protein CONLIGDRAFT_635341 [Coniochaeta ligniaria NRRL 30616]|uniref:Uncharacterized protein n=1 Tax=Coniochaeta ligniaria NRRL 30616 TaxID=1408157 RepID=A0A1J7ICS7_9PEZI|nr:hypothetical protein CONLIGDRAFT_635341 [Coniochaeta ligniaria NRRL 30616]
MVCKHSRGILDILGSTTATAFFERRPENRRARVRDGRNPGLSEQDCVDQQALLGQVYVAALSTGASQPGFRSQKPLALPVSVARPFSWNCPSLTLLKDRQAYLSLSFFDTSYPAVSMLRWQDAKEADFRTLYLESIFSKGVHICMVRLGWKLS